MFLADSRFFLPDDCLAESFPGALARLLQPPGIKPFTASQRLSIFCRVLTPLDRRHRPLVFGTWAKRALTSPSSVTSGPARFWNL